MKTGADKRHDILAIVTILLLCVVSLAGILSINFSCAYDYVNQYGQTVALYGYGIYAFDSYSKAALSVGTDICILAVVVPMFLFSYMKYRKNADMVSGLRLISIYGVSLYYAASIAFGVTYNRLFLAYVLLFSCALFGMFFQISEIFAMGTIRKAVPLTRGLTFFLILSGVALIVAWFPDILPTILTGETLPLIGVYTTEITYVIDMGIVSPILFICVCLLKKGKALGTLLLAVMLKLCIVVGIMMISQTICQLASGVQLAVPVLITKSLSFLILGIVALYFNQKMYRSLQQNKER